ncbi:MAG: bifunctional sulfate adenylyltransferase/adenylylsulfate kinase [Gammaproteobacteria bacterium]
MMEMKKMVNKWILTPRQRCDLEMLLVGGFAPLSGFLTQADYEQVLTHSRLADGTLWPMPINLDVSEEFAQQVELNSEVKLYDPDNTLLAKIHVTDKWKPNKEREAQAIFGTQDLKHPAVNYLFNRAGSWYLGGSVQLVKMPKHYDFVELRHTPATLRTFFAELGWEKIVGFQTRNPMHRAHMELTLRAAQQIGGHVLIHPVVGMTKPGDIDYFTRVRCYEKVLHYYPPNIASLSLLPLAMRMGGPKEALWHALIRKNYGCTHFIVGRDHAGPGNDSAGKPFYDPYAAQDTVREFQKEIGIEMVPFQEMVYVKERKHYCANDELHPNETALTISGTQLRDALLQEGPIPDWFSFPEIIHELRESYPAKHKQGFTIFFTGLSGAGKTTLAQALIAKLMSLGRRNISLLDGDVVRRNLTSELGFSKADRNLNIRRIGFVASEVTKAGGIVLCAAIAPYADSRNENRQLIAQHGGYVEVYLSTSLDACEKRDTKGLYAKARKGELKGFTGIDDPYEPPVNAEVTIDTACCSVEEAVSKIIEFLKVAGYLKTTDVVAMQEKELT